MYKVLLVCKTFQSDKTYRNLKSYVYMYVDNTKNYMYLTLFETFLYSLIRRLSLIFRLKILKERLHLMGQIVTE